MFRLFMHTAGWISIPFYGRTIVYYRSVPKTVYPAVCCSESGCFPFGANRNNAAGNIRVWVFAWTRGFISLGCGPSRRIAGSYCNWKFHFPQPFQTVSPSDYTILPFPLALFEGCDFPHPTYTHYYLFSILAGDKWYLTAFCRSGKMSKASIYRV